MENRTKNENNEKEDSRTNPYLVAGGIFGALAAVATLGYQVWQGNRDQKPHGSSGSRPSQSSQTRAFCLSCKESLSGDDPIFRIDNCRHIFHVRCLQQLKVRRCPWPGCGQSFPPFVASPPTSPPMSPPDSPSSRRRPY